jgi:3-deoxy-D-manno-octulosonic-acid transferase
MRRIGYAMSGRNGAILAGLVAAAGALAEAPLRAMLAYRVRSGKELAARLPERRGIETTPRPAGRLLWMHAASVGETISILPVLHAVAALSPEVGLLLTTGTVTSAEIAAARLPAGAAHRFVPLDVPRWVGRFLDHWRPDVACFVESEIWPNMLAAIAARGVPRVLLNARLSEGSARAWLRAGGLGRRLFGGFALIWARSEADAQRCAVLAGHPVAAPGDLKFAASPLPADEEDLARLQAALEGCPVWIAASIHPGEAAAVAAVHRRLVSIWPRLVTLVVPRHPRRGAEMAQEGMVRRSEGAAPAPGGIYLADTLGELGLFYRLAACAFVGGSLVAHGGQNPLEPARLGLPVAMGPHAENFAEACAVLREAGALREVDGVDALAGWVERMLADPAECAAAGAAGRMAAGRWEDLPERSARALLALMPA